MDHTPKPDRGLDPAHEPDLASLQALIGELGAQDGLARERARRALIDLGPLAVDALIAPLRSPNHTVRLEAATALSAIADPRGVPALIAALDDPYFDVRWLAAVGLIALPEASLVPLLRALERASGGEPHLRAGAHRILRTQLGGPHRDLLAPVVAALAGRAGLSPSAAAGRALRALAGDPEPS